MEATVYNQLGKEINKVSIPAGLFDLPWNADLVHQVATSMRANERTPIAHARDRSEVRGGGKKPWKQKGTGRARHGSTRSPIWVGGGKAHGPRNDKDYSQKINKKMKTKALLTVLSRKFRDGEVIFVDDITFSEPKTKNAVSFLQNFNSISGFEKKKTNKAYIALNAKDAGVVRSFSNINSVEVDELRNINTLSALNYRFLIIKNPAESISILQSKLESKSAK